MDPKRQPVRVNHGYFLLRVGKIQFVVAEDGDRTFGIKVWACRRECPMFGEGLGRGCAFPNGGMDTALWTHAAHPYSHVVDEQHVHVDVSLAQLLQWRV